MENKKFWVGMLVLALVFGMAVVGCDNGSTGGFSGDKALNGTWVGEADEDGEASMELKLDNGSFEVSGFMKGKYTTNEDAGTITITVTHIYGGGMEGILESKWYTKSEMKTAIKAYTIQGMKDGGEWSDEVAAIFDTSFDSQFDNSFFSEYFAPRTMEYVISGNTLTMSEEDEEGYTSTTTYTKQ
jgi:hypothetical protein